MRKFLCGLVGAAALSATPLLAEEEGDLFAQRDTNKDGFITADEVGDENKALFERQLRKADKDGDGKLSREEFAASLKADETPKQPLAGGEGRGGRPGAGQFNPKEAFARMDANKDGKISKDEARGPIEQNFDRIDGDSDGSISEEEFMAAARRLGAGGPEGGAPGREQIEQQFDRADANSDGKLTKDEVPENMRQGFERMLERVGGDSLTKEQFLRFMMARQGGAGRPGEGRPGEGRPPMGPGPLLRALDANGDGEISSEEIAAAPQALAALDRNKDGKLTMDELGPPPGERGRGEGRPEGRPGADRNPIQQFDKDGDGKLSKEEAPDRLKENFDRIDANSDGFIDAAELRQLGGRGRRPEGDRPRDGQRPRDGERRPDGKPRAEPKAE